MGIWAAGRTSGVTASDPYWSNVSLLLHGDTLTDSGPNALALTNNGVTVNTATVKYGSGSLYISGNSQYVRIATNSVLKMESGDFTIEFFINPTSLASSGVVVSNGEATLVSTPNYRVELQSDGKVRFLFGRSYNRWGSIIGDMYTTGTLTTSTWAHVAICKANTSYNIYINGVLDTTATYATQPYDTTASAFFCIGNNSVSTSFVGYLDELRITKGVARYTANFTPPTQAFPNS